ncbi:MAG: hypothetical protein GY774_11115 [Planctomycetes bacterium]|nr:hypothetical protein [Planctomycetota bacterium]|tara:strand:- start:418 stop:855 length:438 start_codon:yes stop_codon:yes gene_type:complete
MDKKTFLEKIEDLKNDEYMSDAQLEIFRARLVTLHAEFEERRKAKESEMMSINMRDASDEADRAQLIELQNLVLREKDGISNLSKCVVNALKAITSEDYGFCLQCGEEIGLERLKTSPFALHHAECLSDLDTTAKKLTGNIRIAG